MTGHNESMPRYFHATISLRIVRGAVRIGDASLITHLKKKGVDPFSIGDDLGAQLTKLMGKRNTITHDSEEDHAAKKAAEAEDVRMWVLKNLNSVVQSLGLKRKYFRS